MVRQPSNDPRRIRPSRRRGQAYGQVPKALTGSVPGLQRRGVGSRVPKGGEADALLPEDVHAQ